ncbi:MAG: response regulator [Acidobacteria bacterium]|nr:response regulator [Acidobacteriota bacterium]
MPETMPRVLIVEDTPAQRYVLSRTLARAGFAVEEACTGAEALDKVLLGPDIVLLDVNLPDMSGFDICRRLRADPRTASLAILHLSASCVAADDQARGLEHGADGYLTQPVDMAVLVATVRALLRMRQAEEAAQRASDEWQATFDAISDGVALLGAAGEIRRWNRSLAAMVEDGGWAEGEEPLPLLSERARELFAEAAASRRVAQRDVAAGPRWLRLRIDPMPGSGGHVDGAVLTVSDISENRRAALELAQKAEELQRSNCELERFAYVVSHDLQEPLRVITSYSQLLERRHRGELTDPAKQMLQFICEGTERMRDLIHDLLAYARLDGNVSLGPVDAGAALSRALANLQASVIESGARFDLGPLPEVTGNEQQLSLVFQNLLGNALKFRGGRTPHIVVQAEPHQDRWLFTVADNGIGIPQHSAERIFNIFQRLHTQSEYPGTGIGLAICRKIVERHGGKIWVESVVGQGSTFRFTLRPVSQV